MMNVATKQQTSEPDPAQIRAQVACMTASNVFRNSPQLASFLQFVVEELLRGGAEGGKGYPIGVEVLRRDTSFDPQIDPIVRVEATRLRRALERYYAGPGVDDTIMISLPRGGYAPRIGWRSAHEAAEPAEIADAAPALHPGNGMPSLRVAPFVVMGTPQTRAVALEALGATLAEGFALFDVINILAAAPPAPRAAQGSAAAPQAPARSDYRLDGVVE